MYDIEQRVIALEAKVNQMVRVCKVSSIDPKAGTARVELPDSDGMESFDLPVLFHKTQDDKFYSMPDIGEQVVCVFLPIGLEQGFVIGSFYSKEDTVTSPSPDKARVDFSNGAFLEHDRDTGRLMISIEGDIDVTAKGNITIIGARIDLNP